MLGYIHHFQTHPAHQQKLRLLCKPVPYLFDDKGWVCFSPPESRYFAVGVTVQFHATIRSPGPLPENVHSGIVRSDNFPANWNSGPEHSSSQTHMARWYWGTSGAPSRSTSCTVWTSTLIHYKGEHEGFVQSNNFLRRLSKTAWPQKGWGMRWKLTKNLAIHRGCQT